MIPETWRAHHREVDGELVGYLVEQAGNPDAVAPVTVFGYPLAPPTGLDDAKRILDEDGLGCLAGHWYLSVDGRADPIAVTIAEVSPSHVTVRNADYGYEGAIGHPFVLTLAEAGRLSPTP